MIDRRVAVAAVLVVGFGAGWFARMLFASATPAPPPARMTGERDVLPPPPLPAGASTEQAFDEIYKRGYWGTNEQGEGHSGTGSEMRTTLLYRTFLQAFLKNNHITSVVDAGCGDWEFSSAMDWTGIDYKGYDIVDSVVEQDKQKYGKPNIQFFHANIVDTDLPPADLLISKQVLQHLPNADVEKFLKQIKKYKFALIMDSVDPITMSGKNQDIQPGQFRPFDPTAPPFNARGFKVLTFWDGYNMQQVVALDTGNH
ncbi:MAG: class I SAM-dependent methyltransferase [Acidobacteriota bacterium]